MTREQADPVLEYTVRIAASPEVVFRHFTDPSLFTRWMGMRAVLDPRPGGRWSVDVNGRDTVAGEFVEVEPYERVVFTWGWIGEASRVPVGQSTVEVVLSRDGPVTVVRLRHLGLPPAVAGSHDQGWRHYLARLHVAAEGRDPGADPLAAPHVRHG